MQNTEVAVVALDSQTIYSVEGTADQLQKARTVVETSSNIEEIICKLIALRLDLKLLTIDC